MPNRYQRVYIEDLGGGENQSVPAWEIDDNQAEILLNWKFDKQNNPVSRFGVTKLNTVTSFTKKITSIHQGPTDTTTIVTAAAEIYRDAGSGTYSSIKGALTLPDDTRWKWVNFNSLAIGINTNTAADGNDSPVKWSGSGNAVALTGTPPDGGTSIAVWNNRVFIAVGTTLHWCQLGDPEDWTGVGSGSLEIDKNSGLNITHLQPHRGNMYIFKRSKIHRIVTGSPNTDPDQWSVDIVSDSVGAVDGQTVQQVLNDLVFLSSLGVMSLALVNTVDDLKEAVLSNTQPLIAALPDVDGDYDSVINTVESQYILVAQDQGSASSNNEIAYVMDFKRLGDRVDPDLVRWTRYKGTVVGNVMAVVYASDLPRIQIGGYNDLHQLNNAADTNPYSDAGAAYVRTMKSKAFDLKRSLERKEFDRWGLLLKSETALATFGVSIQINFATITTESFSFASGNDLWDEGQWDVAVWSDAGARELPVVRRISSDRGRHGRTLQILLNHSNVNQALTVQSMFVDIALKTHKSVTVV